jgi:hypothetical protein
LLSLFFAPSPFVDEDSVIVWWRGQICTAGYVVVVGKYFPNPSTVLLSLIQQVCGDEVEFLGVWLVEWSTSAEYLIEDEGTCWSWSTIFLTKNAASWRDAPATWFLRNGFRRFKRTAARNWQLFSLADMVNLSVAGPSKQLLMIFLGWTLIIFVTFSTSAKTHFLYVQF